MSDMDISNLQVIADEFTRIIGYEDIKKELIGYCDVIRNPEKYEEIGVYQPRGLLIYGEPGIGKSLMANCFINASGRPAYYIRKDSTNNEFINNMRKTFEKAKVMSPSIILIDDMDKFANEDYDHKNAEEYVAIQACIDSVRDSKVFVIATVNDFDMLPESLKRTGRFDKIIELARPVKEDSFKIVSHYLKQKNSLRGINIEEISELLCGNNCSDLEAVINEAGIYAGISGKKHIEKADIVKAYLRLSFQAPESISKIDDKTKKRIAMHEAGHTIVAESLNPGSVRIVSICRHSGSSEGVTSVYKSENNLSYEDIENQIMIALAGRAAIEIFTGDKDMGASDDLKRAYKLIEKLHTKLAVRDFITLSEHTYLDAERQREARTNSIVYDMNKYYDMVKKILVQNKDKYNVLLESILRIETLTCSDIRELFDNVGHVA